MTPSADSTAPYSRLFGFVFETDFPLLVDLPESGGVPDLRLQVRETAELRAPGDRLVYSNQPDRGSDGAITAYRRAEHAAVRFRGVDEFRLTADRIECDLVFDEYAYLVPIQFMGIVMSMWMELRGIPVLHASSAVVGDQAVAFLAVKRGGKTSLAASMARAGHPVLSDDLVPIETGDQVVARPAYPQFRMEPDVAAHFVGDGWEALPIVHPDFEKRRVPLARLGAFCERPVPLGRIYVPERRDGGGIEITPIPGAMRLIELLRDSFLPEMVAGFGLEPKRLRTLGDVAKQVAIKRLRYPSGFERLPQVVEAIEADLRS